MFLRYAAMLVLLFVLACGPTLLFPGGALSGASATPTPDWAWTDEFSTIQLETAPEDPYSVNLWVVGIDQKLYVHAGENRSTWVENMEASSDVRILIDEMIFSLSATRVDEQAEFDTFADAYEGKYGARPQNENVDEAYLYFLTAP